MFSYVIYIYIHTYMSYIFLYNRYHWLYPKEIIFLYIHIYRYIHWLYSYYIPIYFLYIPTYIVYVHPWHRRGPERRFFRLIFGMFQTMDSCLRESFGAWREDQWLRSMGILMVTVIFNIVIIVNGNINGHNNQSYEWLTHYIMIITIHIPTMVTIIG